MNQYLSHDEVIVYENNFRSSFLMMLFSPCFLIPCRVVIFFASQSSFWSFSLGNIVKIHQPLEREGAREQGVLGMVEAFQWCGWEKNNESLLFWAVPSTFLSFLSLKVMLKFIHLKEATRQEGLWGMEVFQCCGKEQTNPWSWCTMTSWTMQVYDMPKLLTSTLLATGGVGGDGGGPALTTWHTPPSCSTMMRSIQDLLAPSFLTRCQMASSASLSRLELCCHVFDLFDFVDRVKR